MTTAQIGCEPENRRYFAHYRSRLADEDVK